MPICGKTRRQKAVVLTDLVTDPGLSYLSSLLHREMERPVKPQFCAFLPEQLETVLLEV